MPTSGLCIRADGLKIGYLAQHQIDVLDMTSTPLDHLKLFAPNVKEVVLRQFLGQFGFIGDCVFQFESGRNLFFFRLHHRDLFANRE